MATTSSNLRAGKAATGQGGNGKNGRYGLKAKLAAGVAALGCAAALVFGGVQLTHSAQADPAANAAVQPAAGTSFLAPIGRTGPSDEYLQADFANTLPVAQRTGPADEYVQAEFAAVPRVIARTGPADEYTQAEGVTPSGVTHGTGPADEYDR